MQETRDHRLTILDVEILTGKFSMQISQREAKYIQENLLESPDLYISNILLLDGPNQEIDLQVYHPQQAEGIKQQITQLLIQYEKQRRNLHT